MILSSICSYYYSISSLHVKNTSNNVCGKDEKYELEGFIFDWNGKVKMTHSNVILRKLPDEQEYHLRDDYCIEFKKKEEYCMYFDDVNNKLTLEKTKYELKFSFDDCEPYDFMVIFNGYGHKVHFD